VVTQPLYGQRLQVIVKAANYVLAPRQTYEGSWHVEGMKHEHIVASGIYYYSTTRGPDMSDSCLAFRSKRSNNIYAREKSNSLSFHENLGKVWTTQE
jgi:hypothetical protein